MGKRLGTRDGAHGVLQLSATSCRPIFFSLCGLGSRLSGVRTMSAWQVPIKHGLIQAGKSPFQILDSASSNNKDASFDRVVDLCVKAIGIPVHESTLKP